MNQYILKIDSQDQKGLIHEISSILFSFGLNIIENEEFVDHGNSYFFMRSEVVRELIKEDVINKLISILPEGADIRLHEKKKRYSNIYYQRIPLHLRFTGQATFWRITDQYKSYY